MNRTLRALALFLLACSAVAHAQRKLPYPIILVHGFAGKPENWNSMVSYFSQTADFYVSPSNRLDYCLNSDGNQYRAWLASDVLEYQTPLLPSDVYLVNFDTCPNSVGSNRSAATKQGYAVGLAVRRVLATSGADKVILVGHSMGGLAIREYLQNNSNWFTGDGQNHVAKLITIGTPHGGSNLGSGDVNLGLITGLVANDYDEMSEAVRDLRYDYKTGYRGVYLYGGYETTLVIRRGFFSSFYNLDVNCNGREGDYVTGLNQKSIPSGLDFACVVGNGYGGSGDLVVNLWSQNLNNFYALNAPVFYHPYGHTEAIRQATFQTMYALDEPSDYQKAYQVKLNVQNRGYLTLQADNATYDVGRYRFEVPSRGVVSFGIGAAAEAAPTCRVVSYNGSVHGTFSGVGTGQAVVPVGGTYFLEVSGTSGNGWRSYNFLLTHCSLPEMPVLAASGPTTFCEGESVTLTATKGYEEYRWFRDGVRLGELSRTLSARQGGAYTCEGVKCGITSKSTNAVSVTVKPAPPVPTLALDAVTRQLTSSSPIGNQWLLGGTAIGGATGQTLPGGSLGAGSYTVQVTVDGCRSTSAPFVVTGLEPVVADEMSISPNPATTWAALEGLSGQVPTRVSIYSAEGKLVRNLMVPVGVKAFEVDLRDFRPGLYAE